MKSRKNRSINFCATIKGLWERDEKSFDRYGVVENEIKCWRILSRWFCGSGLEDILHRARKQLCTCDGFVNRFSSAFFQEFTCICIEFIMGRFAIYYFSM